MPNSADSDADFAPSPRYGLGPAGDGWGEEMVLSNPRRYLLRMVLVLVVVGSIIPLLIIELGEAFQSNLFLNGTILGVLVFGIVYVFHQVIALGAEIRWINNFRHNHLVGDPPRLLGPMVNMLGGKIGRFSLSTPAMRSLLDSIGSRLDEQREISRYLIGLLVFLGLLGTFWGLLQTLTSVSDAISDIGAEVKEGQDLLANLQTSLRGPLTGMGTAFSSSLFGLAGSLVLGFLELISGQAQNRFYNDLEEWLSSLTNLAVTDNENSDHPAPAYLGALVEQTAESLQGLQTFLRRAEEDRATVNNAIRELLDYVAMLGEHLQKQQVRMIDMTESQSTLGNAVNHLVDAINRGDLGMDEATCGSIRNLERSLYRLTEETMHGRAELINVMRTEVKLLARIIAAGTKNN